MIEAVFFDLDGTLTNTIYSIQYVLNIVLPHHGFNGVTEAEAKQVIGDGARNACIRSLKLRLEEYKKENKLNFEEEKIITKELIDDCEKEYKELFSKHFLYKVVAYDGIKDTLKSLKNNNVKIFCVTNKPESATKKTLDGIFGENYFDDFICDDGIQPLKPNPKATNVLIEKNNLKPEECVFVGDTKTDIKTGENAGIKTIGCLWGYRDKDELENANATYIINEPKEILDIVFSKK